MEAIYHIPAMLKETIEGLAIKPNGVYVDVTFGGGGHSRAILEGLEGGRLFSFDQDIEAYKNAQRGKPHHNPPYEGEGKGKMRQVIPLRELQQRVAERELRWVPVRGSGRKRGLRRGCRRGKRQR